MEDPRTERGAALDGPHHVQTLITLADDCSATAAQIPLQKGNRLTVTAFQ